MPRGAPTRNSLSVIKNTKCNKRSGRAIRVLLEFYPDRDLTMGDIRTPDASPDLISDMVVQAHLERADGKRFGGRYQITGHGRLLVLCHELDVPLIGLCILVEAYVAHLRQIKDGTTLRYPVCDTTGKFDYSKKTIQNVLSMLYSRGLAVRESPHMLGLTERAMKELTKHERAVMEVHSMIVNMR